MKIIKVLVIVFTMLLVLNLHANSARISFKSALQTHLFIFWFALLSTITPSVCRTVFIAFRIAQTNWLKVASKAMRLGIELYIIPVAFISNSYLVFPEENLFLSILSFLKISLGLTLLSYGLVNDTKTFF